MIVGFLRLRVAAVVGSRDGVGVDQLGSFWEFDDAAM